MRVISLLSVFALLVFSGCSLSTQAPMKTLYVENNCTRADDFASKETLPITWVVIDINGTEHLATPNGNSLVNNIEAITQKR